MNPFAKFILVILLLLVGAGAGFFVGHHYTGGGGASDNPSTEPTTEEDKPVATVTVAKVREGVISETITAYGSVIADPGDVRILSVQFESRIARVLVTSGQQVDADSEVITLEASPDTRMALQDAKNTVEATARDLQQTQQRFEQHLATNQELVQAQQAQKAAQLKLQSLLERGVDKTQHLTAPMAGVVSKVDVQEGQIVAAGSPLVEIAAQNKLETKLGVEPGDAQLLKPDQVVKVRRVEGASGDEIEGHVRVIGNRVDPTTRLVDVMVALPQGTQLILDSFVQARFDRVSDKGLIVAHEALITTEDGYAIFTVKDGHAIEHDVHLGLANAREAQITADDVKPGDVVALVGALELEDKMPVETKEAATEPTSEPASEPATEPK